MKIFLGYASEHEAVAREIYVFLKGLNEDVWFDKESLIGADEWDREREGAQAEADFLIHLISPEIVTRKGVVNREIRQTLRQAEDQAFGASYVLFVRLADFRLTADFLRFQYIDYFAAGWEAQLFKAIAKRQGQVSGVVRPAGETTTTVTETSGARNALTQLTKVESSTSNEYADADCEYLQYPTSNTYWTFVNSQLASEALGGLTRKSAEFSGLDEETINWIKDHGTRHYWAYAMQEFFRRDDYLSVRSSVYLYEGGAHGINYVKTLNFLGPLHGLCTIKDILQNDDENASRLAEYCRQVLLAMYAEEGLDASINQAFDDKADHWNLVSNFNFDARGLTINFAPYQVLAYAFGPQEVFVPWRFVEPLMGDFYASIEGLVQLPP